jgi:hypothetical protein
MHAASSGVVTSLPSLRLGSLQTSRIGSVTSFAHNSLRAVATILKKLIAYIPASAILTFRIVVVSGLR